MALFVSMGIVACVSDVQPVAGTDGGSPSDDAGSIEDAQVTSDATTVTDSATTPDAEDGSTACNTLDPTKVPAIATVTCVVAKPPIISAGGSIPAGNYYLTNEMVYLGSAAACTDAGVSDFHALAVFAGADGGTDFDVSIANDFGAGQRRNVHFAVTGTGTISATNSCPGNAVTAVQYEVDFPAANVTEFRAREGSVVRTFRRF